MGSMVVGALAALLLTGCATGAPIGGRRLGADTGYAPFARAAAPRAPPSALAAQPNSDAFPTVPAGARETAVQLAQSLVGKNAIVLGGKKYRDDCTGLVDGIYAQLGVNLLGGGEPGDNGVTAIWRYASTHGRLFEGGRPVKGDLVFFRETYDLNRDGRVNDGLTHIGLVEKVGDDGTVRVIHRVARGVVRYKMNLQFRDSAVDAAGGLVNDYLRVAGSQQKPQLTAQLFAGYATLLPIEPRFAHR
jgi:peptidoglycan DL-endopeptidase CwlO